MKYDLLVENTEKAVPLKSVDVFAQVKGYLLALECTLRYQNESNRPLEVIFRFPKDESVAVVGLQANIDGRIIRTKLREKEETEDVDRDGVAPGKTGALGQERASQADSIMEATGAPGLERAGDVFSLALGILGAGKDAQLQLNLVGDLPVDLETGGVRFSLPSVLKSCLIPERSRKKSKVSKSSKFKVQHAFTLLVWEPQDVSSVTSPTHELLIEDMCGHLDVILKQSGPLDKEIVILIHHKDPHRPKAIVENGNDENEFMASPVVMLNFFPKFESTQTACELVFLIDRSGRMHEKYIKSVQEALILFLRNTPCGCYFNIMGHDHSYNNLFPTSVPCNQSNLEVAMKSVHDMQEDLVRSSLLWSLGKAFKKKCLPEGLPRKLLLLTNGSLPELYDCITEMKEYDEIPTVFTIGIHSGTSTALVKELAHAGNGSAEFINEGERMQPKVIRTLKKALQPQVTDVQLHFLVPAGVEVQQAPNNIPPIFSGDQLTIYTVFKTNDNCSSLGRCKAVLHGRIMGEDVEQSVEFCFDCEEEPWCFSLPFVHQLVAKNLIKDWEGIWRTEPWEGPFESDRDRELAIATLSILSAVVSCRTTYVVDRAEQSQSAACAKHTYHTRSRSVSLPAQLSARAGSSARAESSARGRSFSSTPGTHASAAPYQDGPTSSTNGTDSRLSVRDDMVDQGDDTAGKTAKKFKDDPVHERVSHLIDLQQDEGYWDLTRELKDCMTCPLLKMTAEHSFPVDERTWATALALTLLYGTCLDYQDAWKLAASRAQNWLKKEAIDITELVQMLLIKPHEFLRLE